MFVCPCLRLLSVFVIALSRLDLLFSSMMLCYVFDASEIGTVSNVPSKLPACAAAQLLRSLCAVATNSTTLSAVSNRPL